MFNSKKTIAILILTAFVIAGTAATNAPQPTFKNLKVLPQDISERQLDSLMHVYNKALKVNCKFCHVKANDPFTGMPTSSDELDFSLDNGMKESAREMIRLTIDINKRYFPDNKTIRPDHLLNVVTCNTCHRGNAYPAHE